MIGAKMLASQKNVLINDDEYAMLSEMLLETETEDEAGLKYFLSGQSGAEKLLFQILLAEDLQLVANYGNHNLVFPVEMEKEDFSGFSLTVKPPHIFEVGEQLRSWRLAADKKMSLVDEAGNQLPYRVKDISASGISLLIDKDTDKTFPTQLQDIFLKLPNRDRLPITADKIRRVDEQTMAYSLGDDTDDQVLTSLAEYLFERHEALYGRGGD